MRLLPADQICRGAFLQDWKELTLTTRHMHWTGCARKFRKPHPLDINPDGSSGKSRKCEPGGRSEVRNSFAARHVDQHQFTALQDEDARSAMFPDACSTTTDFPTPFDHAVRLEVGLTPDTRNLKLCVLLA